MREFTFAELYGEAILHDCSFFYEFDVTNGFIKNEFHTKNNYNPFFGLRFQLPFGYDEFNTIRRQRLNMIAETDLEAEYWTCKGLKRAYAEGHRSVTIRYDSELLQMSWIATIILSKDEEDDHLHAIYMCRDMTDIKRAERLKRKELADTLEEARIAKKTTAKLLYNMSHDIRDSLVNVEGFASLAQRHAGDEEKVREYSGKIKSVAEYMNALIDNALEVAKIENSMNTLNEKPWNIHEFNDMIFLIFSEAIREKKIDFKRTFKLQHENVLCDTKKLREVFCCIIADVLEKTPAGGSIDMNIVEIPTDRPGYVIIKTVISHTSSNTSQKEAEQLLEGYNGQSNIKTLVEVMEGSASVQCAEGFGRLFTVILPHRVAPAQDDNDQRARNFNSEEFVGKRILLVEDNALNSEIESVTLEDLGFEVEFAEDGDACMEMLEAVSPDYYDLVMMDLQLPSISGYQACREIRALRNSIKASIPVVAVTIHGDDESKRDAFEAGMNGFLTKPVEMDKLMELMRNIFS